MLQTLAVGQNKLFAGSLRKKTQNTSIEFLSHYRITQAKRMLLSGITISQSSYSSGFESHSYFNRILGKSQVKTLRISRKNTGWVKDRII